MDLQTFGTLAGVVVAAVAPFAGFMLRIDRRLTRLETLAESQSHRPKVVPIRGHK